MESINKPSQAVTMKDFEFTNEKNEQEILRLNKEIYDLIATGT